MKSIKPSALVFALVISVSTVTAIAQVIVGGVPMFETGQSIPAAKMAVASPLAHLVVLSKPKT